MSRLKLVKTSKVRPAPEKSTYISCFVCSADISVLDGNQQLRHVNLCLDGGGLGANDSLLLQAPSSSSVSLPRALESKAFAKPASPLPTLVRGPLKSAAAAPIPNEPSLPNQFHPASSRVHSSIDVDAMFPSDDDNPNQSIGAPAMSGKGMERRRPVPILSPPAAKRAKFEKNPSKKKSDEASSVLSFFRPPAPQIVVDSGEAIDTGGAACSQNSLAIRQSVELAVLALNEEVCLHKGRGIGKGREVSEERRRNGKRRGTPLIVFLLHPNNSAHVFL
jgi:hypothetical protein